MQQEIKIVPINAELYPAYYKLVQATQWGNPMLPIEYNNNLWGDVLLDGTSLVGGWVGIIRGDIPLARLITKSVYFDAYPVFTIDEIKDGYQDMLIDSMKLRAKQEGITMFNLTHWIRFGKLDIEKINRVASFVVDLEQDEEQLLKNIDSAKQRNLKKAKKFDLEILVCKGEESIKYLDDFQCLRENTQSRALSRNKQASMLLKSNKFFHALMMQPNAYLLIGKYEGSVASVALMLKGGDTVYYYSGGSDIEVNRKTCCSAYMFWKALLHFKEKGIKYFDFGGCPVSPDEYHPAYGVYRFKKGFGGKYIEFVGGHVIISYWRYKILQFILSQRKLLRFFSKKF